MKIKCVLIHCLFLTTATIGQPTKTFTITGRVIDYMARPVEGAEVVVYEEVFYDDKDVAKSIVIHRLCR